MTEILHSIDIIRRKRDGLALSAPEIQHLIREIVGGRVSDAQIAAFLMAAFIRGLKAEELGALTAAMRFSGETFDPTPLGTFAVDKHSTGGVGDKTSLLIAPVIAAAGIAGPKNISIPMISGRALGHTGGTLDKLETIPGFNTQLSLAELGAVLKRTHAALVGQTPNLVPADRILYALRDHTATVESPYLICASIMSKKLAAGLNALVLDVKTGSGAFMEREQDARFLAELMVRTGEAAGARTTALLTSMEQPLGRFSGNWVEVWECVDIMKGVRHPMSADLIELSNALSGWMLFLSGVAETPKAGMEQADELLRSGAAYKAWLAMVEAQGGDTAVFDDPGSHHKPAATRILRADRDGFLSEMNCREVGSAVQRLGAGRLAPGDPVDAHAGIEVHTKIGARLKAGQPMLTMFARSDEDLTEPEQMLLATIKITDAAPSPLPLIRDVITSD